MEEFKSIKIFNQQNNVKQRNNSTSSYRKIDKEQMLITMPYLSIKHKTWVPSTSFRGKINLVSAYQGISRRVSNQMSQNVWACLVPLPAPYLTMHPPANRLEHQSTSRRHAKNQVCQEPATEQNQQEQSNHHQPLGAIWSCNQQEAVRSCN